MKQFTIAHLSDLHCGSPHFVPSLLDRALVEVNELAPEVVIVSGDLTGDGLRGEFQEAADYLSRIACQRMIVIPGTTTRATSDTSTSRSCSASAGRSCTTTGSRSWRSTPPSRISTTA